VAPPGTPQDKVQVFRDAIKRAVVDPEFQAWVKKSGMYLKPQDPKSTWVDLEGQGKVFASLAEAVAAAREGK
jgi:tripartite-type tricarboxylate transporter receptor subunit TctC